MKKLILFESNRELLELITSGTSSRIQSQIGHPERSEGSRV